MSTRADLLRNLPSRDLADLLLSRVANPFYAMSEEELQDTLREAARRLVSSEAETVICAAIRTVEGIIVRGHRHDGCLRYAATIRAVDETKLRDAEQGFVTSRNRFVDRIEGRNIQEAAGIPSQSLGGYRGYLLYSEDLY